MFSRTYYKQYRLNGLRIYCILFFFIFFTSLGCHSKETMEGQIQQDDITLVKVAFWGSPDEIEIITDCIKDWETSHPYIKVRFEHTPYGGYVSKILTRIAGNAAPDNI